MNKKLIECTIKAIEEAPTLGIGHTNQKCALYYLAKCADISDTDDYDAMGDQLGDQTAITLLWETNDWCNDDRPIEPIGNKQGVLDLLRSWL